MDLVLISAKQGGGKTTTAKALQQIARPFYDVVYIIKFAEPLYMLHDQILAQMSRFTHKPKPMEKCGPLLQYLGTDFGRKYYGENVWVDIAKLFVQEKMDDSKMESISTLMIFDDCRFENEFDAFPQALRVRLEASEDVRKTRAESWRNDILHPSEIGLDKYLSEGKFDLVLKTDIVESSPEHCATLILAQLHKGNWIDKREKL